MRFYKLRFVIATLVSSCEGGDASNASESANTDNTIGCDVETRCNPPPICGTNGVTIAGVGGYCGELGMRGEWFCAFSALRDNTPGTLAMFLGEAGHPECNYRKDVIEILGDGTAILRQDPYLQHVLIRPPDHFTQCLETGDPSLCGEAGLSWFEGGTCEPQICCPFPSEENRGC